MPTALLSGELPGAEQVELDCAGDTGPCGGPLEAVIKVSYG
jgi:hypothetical protein